MRRRLVRHVSLALASFLAFGLVRAAPAAADTAVVAETPISGTITSPCTGEDFLFTGFIHTEARVVIDLVDGSVHIRDTHLNTHDVRGVGALGGQYVVTAVVNPNANGDIIPDFAPITAVDEERLLLTHLSESGIFIMGDDFYMTVRAKMTINANGVVTVDRDDMFMECR